MQDSNGRPGQIMREHAIAQRLGLEFSVLREARLHPQVPPGQHLAAARNGAIATLAGPDGPILAVSPQAAGENRLAAQISSLPASRTRILATTRDALVRLYLRDAHADIAARAVARLERRFPAMCARRTLTPG